MSLFCVMVILTQLLAVGASAHSTPVQFDWTYEGTRVTVAYSMDGDVVCEKMCFYFEDKTVEYIREIAPDGTACLTKDGKVLHTGTVDYVTFYSLATTRWVQNSLPAPAQAYATYPCGRDQTHMYVDTNKYTIDVEFQKDIDAMVEFIIVRLVGKVNLVGGALASMAMVIANAVKRSNAKANTGYVDVTEDKYFIYNDYGNLNCYHAFLKIYHYENSSLIVDGTEWDYRYEFI